MSDKKGIAKHCEYLESKIRKKQFRIDELQTQLKQKDEVIEKLERWLEERWECPGSKIYVGEIVKEIRDLKGDNNE